MMPLESSMSDDAVWSITLEASITILEAAFTIIYDVFSTGITYEDYRFMIIICL